MIEQAEDKVKMPASQELLKSLYARAPEILERYGSQERAYGKDRTSARFYEVGRRGGGHGELWRPSEGVGNLMLTFNPRDDRKLIELEWEIDRKGAVLSGVDRYNKDDAVEPPSENLIRGVFHYFERQDQERRPCPSELLRELFKCDCRRYDTYSLDDVPTGGGVTIKLREDGVLYLWLSNMNFSGPRIWLISADGQVLHGETSWWDHIDDWGGDVEIGPPTEAQVRDILKQMQLDGHYTPPSPESSGGGERGGDIPKESGRLRRLARRIRDLITAEVSI